MDGNGDGSASGSCASGSNPRRSGDPRPGTADLGLSSNYSKGTVPWSVAQQMQGKVRYSLYNLEGEGSALSASQNSPVEIFSSLTLVVAKPEFLEREKRWSGGGLRWRGKHNIRTRAFIVFPALHHMPQARVFLDQLWIWLE